MAFCCSFNISIYAFTHFSDCFLLLAHKFPGYVKATTKCHQVTELHTFYRTNSFYPTQCLAPIKCFYYCQNVPGANYTCAYSFFYCWFWIGCVVRNWYCYVVWLFYAKDLKDLIFQRNFHFGFPMILKQNLREPVHPSIPQILDETTKRLQHLIKSPHKLNSRMTIFR